MRSMRILVLGAALSSVIGPAVGRSQEAPGNPPPPPRAGLTLSSPTITDGGLLPAKHTRADPNPVSPKLGWTNVLPNAVTFALILHDLDSSRSFTTEDVLHWMVFNIPASVHELPEGLPGTVQLPNGATQGKNRAGTPGFFAPAAAAGPYHHYAFELYELDTKLSVGPDVTRAELLKAMDGHVIERASLVGRFHR